MIFLYVMLGILALLILLLIAYLRIQIFYTNGIFSLCFRIGPIWYKVPMQKNTHYRTLAKKLRKKKLSAPSAIPQKKERKKSQALEELRGDLPMPVFLKKLKDILIQAAGRYAKKLHIQIDRLRITVGSENAAVTGISYGICAQSTAYLLEFLDTAVTLTPIKKNAVQIQADFTGTWDAEIKGTVKIRIIHLLQALFKVFFSLKSYTDQDMNPQQRFNNKV